VAEKIKVALSFGDLSENSEYDEAKNEQAMVEARIAQLEAILKNAKVLEVDDLGTDVVSLGSKVKIRDVEFDEEMEYSLVSSIETDPANGKISDESPIGKAIMGHRIGETVEAETPAGPVQFEILEITR